jgi:hypothetical protein
MPLLSGGVKTVCCYNTSNILLYSVELFKGIMINLRKECRFAQKGFL